MVDRIYIVIEQYPYREIVYFPTYQEAYEYMVTNRMLAVPVIVSRPKYEVN